MNRNVRDGSRSLEHSRRLRACIAVADGFLLMVSAVAALRKVLVWWGFPLVAWQDDAVLIALVVHGAGAVLLTGLLLFVDFDKPRSPTASRVALGLMPIMLLVSIDRLAAISYAPIPEETILQAHPVRGWTSRPGWVEHLEDRVVRINGKGLRGPEIPYEKSEGERRVVILGDSITFGIRVREEDGFVHQLSKLASRADPTARITFINCSVTGYSPWQEYDLLESECIKYEPDVVVQVFCLNDVVEKFALRRFGGPTRGLEPRPPSALEWSGLLRMVRAFIERGDFERIGQAQRDQVYTRVTKLMQEPQAPDVREAWRITLENMRKIQSVAREHGAAFAIVCFPYAEQMSPLAPDSSPPQRELAAFAMETGIPFLDLLPAYRRYCRRKEVIDNTARHWEGLAIFPDRIHPTPEGHEIAAREIYEFLVREGLLDGGDRG